jgi:hypothetical protein
MSYSHFKQVIDSVFAFFAKKLAKHPSSAEIKRAGEALFQKYTKQ